MRQCSSKSAETINNLFLRLDDFWNRSSRKKKIFTYICIYTMIFSLTAVITYSPFIVEKKSFIWASDGRYMNWPALIYIGNWLRELIANILNGTIAFKMFDLNLGMGADVIGTLNFFGFGDPINILALLVPTLKMEYLYLALAIIRIYLSGLTFSHMCFYFKKPAGSILIGAMIYCFNGFSMYHGPANSFFMNLLIQLPLLVIGCDLIINHDRKRFLILSAFYVALCGFYSTYILTLVMGVFVFIQLLFNEIKDTKKIFLKLLNIAFAYICGIGMAAVIFLPAVCLYFSCSRIAGEAINTSLLYTSNWYKNTIMLMFAPFANGSNLECNYLSIAPLAFYALIIVLSGKRDSLKIWSIISFFVLLLPAGGSVMNGFSYATNRWAFAMILLFAYLVVEKMPQLLVLSNKHLKSCTYGCLIYTFFIIFIKQEADAHYATIGAIFVSVTLLILLVQHQSIKKYYNKKNHLNATRKYLLIVVCLFLVIVNVGTYGIYIFSTDKGNFASEFSDTNVLSSGLETHLGNQARYELSKDPDGRVEFSARSSYRNTGAIFQVPSVPFYWNMVDSNISEYWKESETPGLYTSYKIGRASCRERVCAYV